MVTKFKSKREIFEEQEEKEHKKQELLKEVEEEVEKEFVKKIISRSSYERLKAKTGHRTNDEEIPIYFYIGTKDKLEGQISFVTEEQKEKYVLIRIVRKIDTETGEIFYYPYFFTDPIPQRERGNVIKSLTGDFYKYIFKTKEKTYQLFSDEKLGLGEYFVQGTIIEITDYVDVGNYAKIGTSRPLLFIHSAFPKENEIQDHKEFFERFKRYKLTEKKFIEWLYTSKEGWIYEFPKNFSYVQIANILACPNGFNSFHMPVLVIGVTGTGKTTATEIIFYKFKESFKYIKMTGSTLKGLIPSFANPIELRPGLFLEAQNFIPTDEFFPGVSKLHTNDKENVLENIKDLLDYEIGSYASGHGKITGQMKADHIALTNPKSYGNNILQLSQHFQPENLARYLIWYAPESQKKFIDEQKEKMKRGDPAFMPQEDFIAGLKYLKTFNCDYNRKKVREVYEIGKGFLSSKGEEFDKVRAFYTSRYFEHACRLIDALIKLRCWCEGDKKFKATKEDYEKLENIWREMLENWGMDFLETSTQKM